MKAFVFLVIMSSFQILTVKAQLPAGNRQDQIAYLGYVIRLIPVASQGYGYDIFFKNRMVAHQSVNPFTLAPTGIRQKDDAYKMAEWQVREVWQSKPHAIMKNRLVSRTVARKLSIPIQ